MRRKFLKTMTACAGACMFAASARAEARTLRFANQNAKGHPIVQGMERLAQLVATKTSGRLKIAVSPGGQLGNDQACLAALQGGSLEMASMNSGILAGVRPEFAVFDLPFMINSIAEADAILNGTTAGALHSKLEGSGLVGLGYFELGFRDISNSKRPINKAEDLEGLKLRVIPNPINTEWVAALGATAVPLPFNELPAALSQKTVDGQENPVATILAAKLYESQPHLALTHHQYNPQSVLVSGKVWETLSPEDRKAITEAVQESATFQRAKSREAASSALENLEKNGVQVTKPSADELAKLRNKVKPVINKYGRSIHETVSLVQGEIAALRK